MALSGIMAHQINNSLGIERVNGMATKRRKCKLVNGIILISVTQDFGDGDEGYMIRGVTHLMNEMQSRKIGKHTHAGMMLKANKAGHCGGIAPLGYSLDAEGNLVINEDEAETVRKIFEMFELNYSYSRMADQLNAEGRRTKRGRMFDKFSFDGILHQEKYTGTYIWNKTRQKDSKSCRNSHAQKPVDKQVRIEGGCPQIITPEQFWRVQETLAKRACGSSASKSRHHYMLGGLKFMKCAECGSYMVGAARKSHGVEYTYYACPKHKDKHDCCPTKEIRAEYVNEMVTRILVKDFHERTDHAQLSKLMKRSDEYKKLTAKRAGIEQAINGVLDALEKSSAEELVERLNKLSSEKKSIERAIAASKTKKTGITDENYKKIRNRLGCYLRDVDDPDAKAYLVKVIKEIKISNDEVTIEVNVV